ncbi:hypothetical protein [Desertimonas flava]|uniref:hypothetical protein n=1 Tax=Desertimonas flava TaxID=2064846 RepID=UPI000E3542EB|nr:hypothetical protein [Desertimonas flava]
MSAASDYGVAIVDRLIRPPLDAGDRNVFAEGDPATAVGDVIAYLLHWAEANGVNESSIGDVLELGRSHWEAERGAGDDLAQGYEDRYHELISLLT